MIISSCRDAAVQKGGWIPALEDTSFTHLKTAGEQLQDSLGDLQSNLDKGQLPEAQRILANTEEEIFVILYYDIPITEVRQLIYDAGRLHALDRPDETLAYLNRADVILAEIGTHGNASLYQALHAPRVMIEKLRETLGQESRATSSTDLVEISHAVAEQFSVLGHKVNMMAIKGDLILSGASFNQQQDAK